MTEGDAAADVRAAEKAFSVHSEGDCSHVRICKPGTGAGQDAERLSCTSLGFWHLRTCCHPGPVRVQPGSQGQGGWEGRGGSAGPPTVAQTDPSPSGPGQTPKHPAKPCEVPSPLGAPGLLSVHKQAALKPFPVYPQLLGHSLGTVSVSCGCCHKSPPTWVSSNCTSIL